VAVTGVVAPAVIVTGVESSENSVPRETYTR
jgi:hypothetical protein